MASEKITNAELEIMRVVWKSDVPRSVADIRIALAETLGWKATTVKTLLYNLRDKGAVEEVKRGVYRAVIRESDVTRDFITRVFDGSAKKLVASLIDDNELSEDDISELRKMLARGSDND